MLQKVNRKSYGYVCVCVTYIQILNKDEKERAGEMFQMMETQRYSTLYEKWQHFFTGIPYTMCSV